MKQIVITALLTFTFTAFAIQAVEQTLFSASGIIESTSGGFKFPDGSTQSSAATVSKTDYYFVGPSAQPDEPNLRRAHYDEVCQNDYSNAMARMCTSVEIIRTPFSPAFSQGVRVEPVYGGVITVNNGTSFYYIDKTGFIAGPTSFLEVPNCFNWSYVAPPATPPAASFLVVDTNKTIVEQDCLAAPALQPYTACCVPRE